VFLEVPFSVEAVPPEWALIRIGLVVFLTVGAFESMGTHVKIVDGGLYFIVSVHFYFTFHFFFFFIFLFLEQLGLGSISHAVTS